MNLIKEIKNIRKFVTKLLTNHTHLRDDDNKLIANVWYEQLTNKDISCKEFLIKFASGELVSPESIRRCRQKIQEQNKHLRGDNYKIRTKEGVEVRKEIKNI